MRKNNLYMKKITALKTGVPDVTLYKADVTSIEYFIGIYIIFF